MALDEVAARGLVLLGCGKMGGALLKGWLAGGLPASPPLMMAIEAEAPIRSAPACSTFSASR